MLWAPQEGFGLGPDVSEDLPRYREWRQAREATRLASVQPAPAAAPELAFVLVLAQPDPVWVGHCLRSLAAQTSPNWHLSVAIAGPLAPEADAMLGASLGDLPAGHTDVHAWREGVTAPDAARDALDATTSPAFALLGPDEELAPDAVALLTAALVDADLAYGDEDQVDEEGRAVAPALKPDWSPELFLARNYLGRPVAVRRAPVEAAGGLRELAHGDWEHDFLLRVTERTDRVAHVAEVLSHRRRSETTGWRGGDQAVVEALGRRRADATVEPGPIPKTWHVRWRPAHRPSVTAIVPFRDSPRLLRACVDSVSATAGDVDLDLLLVDNGSEELETLSLLDRLGERPDITVLHDPRSFNWAVLNNAAVADAKGDVLLFLNNDVEALREGWLGALAGQALREEVGAAGARLLFPTGRLQHAGVVLGMAGAAGHVLAGLAGGRPGYLGMAVLARDCSAVTGACLATRATVFERLGGFDETLGLDLNDIDYCLRARGRGLRVVYEPAAELVHHESPSRGTSGSAPDQVRFLDQWEGAVTAGDPYLSPHLTRVDCSAALRRGDEEGWWERWRANLTK